MMTEQEVIQYLRNNRKNGVAYGFMPVDVRRWCDKNRRSLTYFSLVDDNDWPSLEAIGYALHATLILSITEDFELLQESKSNWVEFEIDDDGDFAYLAESDKDEHCKTYYTWFAWQRFLEDSRVNERGFTAFGGWQYQKSKTWLMSPQVEMYETYSPCQGSQDDEAKPAIPTKIRFWRKAK